MKRIALGVLIAALLVPLAAPFSAQAAERLMDVTRLFAMLDKFYATPLADRSKLALRYTITQDGKPPSAVHLTLVVDGRRTPIPLSPDGVVERLPSAADLAAHAEVAIDAPTGVKFANRLDIDTAIHPTSQISAAECRTAIDQANAAIRRAAGMMAMMAPKVKATTFVGAGSGVAVMTDGRTVALPLIKGAPAYDPDTMKGARTIQLSRPPTLVSLE